LSQSPARRHDGRALGNADPLTTGCLMRLSRGPFETGDSMTSEPSICDAPLGHAWVPTVFWASQEAGVSRRLRDHLDLDGCLVRISSVTTLFIAYDTGWLMGVPVGGPQSPRGTITTASNPMELIMRATGEDTLSGDHDVFSEVGECLLRRAGFVLSVGRADSFGYGSNLREPIA